MNPSKQKQKQKQKRCSKTISIRLPEERWQIKDQLTQVADALGCSVTTLIWYSIEQMLLNPPTTLPAPVVKSTKGFWVKLILSPFHVVAKVEVIEVLERNTVKAGRYFFGYDGGKTIVENRRKALLLAKREANILSTKLGFDQPPTLNLL